MFCRKCGKQISEGTMCYDCASMEFLSSQSKKVSYTNATNLKYYNEPEPNNAMYGFGRALTATILGFIGFIWHYIIIVDVVDEDALFVVLLMGLPFVIIPLINGIISIRLFVRRKNTCAKPIAPFILGIVGLSFAAFSAILSFALLSILMSYV